MAEGLSSLHFITKSHSPPTPVLGFSFFYGLFVCFRYLSYFVGDWFQYSTINFKFSFSSFYFMTTPCPQKPNSGLIVNYYTVSKLLKSTTAHYLLPTTTPSTNVKKKTNSRFVKSAWPVGFAFAVRLVGQHSVIRVWTRRNRYTFHLTSILWPQRCQT